MADSSTKKEYSTKATRTFPYVHLSTGSRKNPWWAGGYITDEASDAYVARLISSNGQLLEDTVQDKVVLFLTNDQIEEPLQLELYNRSNELIGKQTLLNNNTIS